MFKVNVGLFWFNSVLPYGSKPDLINAWNPLQIPKIKPFLESRELIASLIFGLFKTFAIYLPEPSGSSSALNPPVKTKISDLLICHAISLIEFINASFVSSLNLVEITFPPTSLNALIVSSSQLVPLNDGI